MGKLARGGLLSLFGAGVSAALNLGFVILISRLAVKSDIGVFFAATSVFLVVATVAKLGSSTGVVYFIARLRALGHSSHVRGYVAAAFLPVVALSVLLALVLFAAAPELARRIVDTDTDAATASLRLLAVVVPLAALLDLLLGITRGYSTVRPLVFVEKIGRPAAQLVLVLVALALGGAEPVWLVSAWAAPYLPAALVAAFLARRLMRKAHTAAPADRSDPAPNRRAVRSEFWRFTGPRSVSSVAQVVLQRLDIVLIAALRGAEEAAVYGAVTRVLVVGSLGQQAIAVVVQPRISSLVALSDKREVSAVYQTSTAWLMLVTWPIYLLLAVFAAEVTQVFGPGYSSGSGVILLLTLTMLFATGCGLVDVVLTMAGRSTWVLGNTLAALVINITLNLLLIPRMGIMGAAIAWTCSIVAKNALPLGQLAVSLRLQPFGRRSALAAGMTVLLFGAIPLASKAAFGNDLVTIAGTVATVICVYALLLFRLRRRLALNGLLRRGGSQVTEGKSATSARS